VIKSIITPVFSVT